MQYYIDADLISDSILSIAHSTPVTPLVRMYKPWRLWSEKKLSLPMTCSTWSSFRSLRKTSYHKVCLGFKNVQVGKLYFRLGSPVSILEFYKHTNTPNLAFNNNYCSSKIASCKMYSSLCLEQIKNLETSVHHGTGKSDFPYLWESCLQ